MEYSGNLLNQLTLGDCVQVLPRLPDSSVHLILSDIPYGISADEWDVIHNNKNSALLGSSPAQRKAGAVFKKRGKPINGWSKADRDMPQQYYEWCMRWTQQCNRVLKPGGSAIIFAGRRFFHRCISAMEDSGMSLKDTLAWLRPKAPHRAQRLSVVYEKRGDHKNAKNADGWRVGNLRPTFEPIIWMMKPYKIGTTIADNMLSNEVGAYCETAFRRYADRPDNVLKIGFKKNEGGDHIAQKPIELMQALIELTTKQGHIVLDPFAGSGTTAIAASLLGRNFVAIEADQKIADIGRRRLREECMPLLAHAE